MKSLGEIKQLLREQQEFLTNKYGVTIVGVFGSYVRGEQGTGSDVDLLIELSPTAKFDLLDLVELENHLSELLGTKVDIAIKRNLRKRIGRRILNEVVAL